MLKDNKFEFGNVVWMNPVFCGVANKVLLGATSRGVALDGVAAGANKVVLFGEFDN